MGRRRSSRLVAKSGTLVNENASSTHSNSSPSTSNKSNTAQTTTGVFEDEDENDVDMNNLVIPADAPVDDEEHDSNDEDENSDLERLSSNYRRFSESRRAYETHFIDEQRDEYDDEENDFHHDYDEETDSQNEHSDNQDEDEDVDMDEEVLHNAFMSLAGRLGRQQDDNSQTVGRDQPNRFQIYEQLFPGAAHLFGDLAGGSSTRMQDYVRALQNKEDPYLTLETLNELSERLLMMNGAIGQHIIPSYDLCKAIVGVLDEPFFQEDLELQLVACRCMYNLLEINEQFVTNAVRAGVIESLQNKLAEISSIDLAEQALQTLEFISRFSGTSVFRKNAVAAALMYLDFFTTHAQRKAISIAANSVKVIRTSEFALVENIFPALQRVVIEFTDSQELDTAWLAITRIVRSFQNEPDKMAKLVSVELVNQIFSVLSNTETNLSTTIRLFHTLASCSHDPRISQMIIKAGKLNSTIVAALSKYKKNSNEEILSINTLMAVPKDLMSCLLFLIFQLLPADESSLLIEKSKIANDDKSYIEIKPHYIEFISGLFPLLIDIYSASAVYDTRRLVLANLTRIVHSVDKLEELTVDHSPIINLVASIILQNKAAAIRGNNSDPKPYSSLLAALTLTKMLLSKSSDIFIREFEREGLLADTVSLSEIIRNHLPPTSIEDQEVGCEPSNDSQYEDSAIDDDGQEQDVDDDNESEYDDRIQHPTHPIPANSPFKNLSVDKLLDYLLKEVEEVDRIYSSRKAKEDGSKLGHLEILDVLKADLSNDSLLSSYTYQDMIRIWGNFKTALFSDEFGFSISCFELISSGIIPIIGKIFQNYDNSSILKKSFVEVFSKEINGDETAGEGFVKKLQESLTRSESFEIFNCGLKSGENKTSSLGKNLKVKLTAVDDTEGLFKSIPQFIIMVHAIASFSNVNLFLKRRVTSLNSIGQRMRDSEENDDDDENDSVDRRQGNDWHIEFLLNGKPVPSDTTVFGALYKEQKSKDPTFNTTSFWLQEHEMTFRKAPGDILSKNSSNEDERYPTMDETEYLRSQNILEKDTTLEILDLLKSLHDLNVLNPTVFLNYKLSAKLNRQLEEPLVVAAGILPNWSIYITRKFPFLFPLEIRLFFLQSTSFGYSRLVQLWSNKAAQESVNNSTSSSATSISVDTNNLPLGRPTRHKVRVSRSHLLPSCFKILDKLGSHPSVLEVEFNDEVGTGLGPTLEFYSLCSHLFAKKSLKIWRDTSLDQSSEFIEGTLFPTPLKEENSDGYKEKLSYFRYLGMFVARALLDGRIVDFNFSKIFFEMISLQIDDPDHEFNSSELLNKLTSVDPKLASSFTYMLENPEELDSMFLTFTLPGNEDIELCDNGSSITVDSKNVLEYIGKVLKFILVDGVKKQMEQFVVGFSEIFQYFAMLIFSPDELSQLFGNFEEDWSYETLLSVIRADHGYNLDSPTVRNLITVVSKLSMSDRRLLLQFLTGSPRLPIGGFKNLKPELTIVLKSGEDGLKADDILPSVMTCANYLKLPNYSTIEILEQRLRQAFTEGAGAFHLS